MRPLACLLLLHALVSPGIAHAGRLDKPSPGRPTRPSSNQSMHGPAARASASDPASLCEGAIKTAESTNRLPARMLAAISLTETGRVDPVSGRVRPWPWTINAEGVGQFFPTRQEAILAVTALQARGVKSIDVGCLQVNLMYHPDAFATLEEAFDPSGNASYAARFLNLLYAERRDWAMAIAAYHSDTPALGDAYRTLVMARWQGRGWVGAEHVVYGDFARAGRAYGDGEREMAYRAFAPSTRIYAAFASH